MKSVALVLSLLIFAFSCGDDDTTNPSGSDSDVDGDSDGDGDSDTDADGDSDTTPCDLQNHFCWESSVCTDAGGQIRNQFGCEDPGDVCCELPGPDGDTDSDGDSDTSCVEGDTRCQNMDTIETCTAEGEWDADTDCGSVGMNVCCESISKETCACVSIGDCVKDEMDLLVDCHEDGVADVDVDGDSDSDSDYGTDSGDPCEAAIHIEIEEEVGGNTITTNFTKNQFLECEAGEQDGNIGLTFDARSESPHCMATIALGKLASGDDVGEIHLMGNECGSPGSFQTTGVFDYMISQGKHSGSYAGTADGGRAVSVCFKNISCMTL